MPAMYCKHCYANLDQAIASRCARCNRRFDLEDPKSYLVRPFPSRGRIVGHALLMLLLATAVSAVVAGFLAIAQMKFMPSGH